MDRQLPEEVRQHRKKKAIWIAVIAVVVLVLSAWLLREALGSSISRSAITTAIVERGIIENTINASGIVIPEFEEVITSPINASVQRVLMEPGSKVKTGQSVLTLDKSASTTILEKLTFQLESKRNDIRKLKLQLDKSFYDIRSNNDIKQLRINSDEADVENATRLFKAGGGTREDIEKAALNLKVAKLEKQQLENEIKSKQQTMQVEMKEATIAAAIQENELHELGRKLKLANITASRDGVVTWVNKNIGAAIREGDPLVRIADLASFKIQGSIADSYLNQLHNAMTAVIRINETSVRGKVVNIQPAIQNGIVLFDIQLDQRNNVLFRPDMKVDVYLVTAMRDNVMRVANGPAFKGSSTQDIFVMNKGKAIRRNVHTGMSNFDFVEVIDNVVPGETIITSDLSAYLHAREIKIVP